MKQKIVLLVGVPGSGKTWVCDQVKDKFTHLAHDDYMKQKGNAYVDAAMKQAQMSNKPVLIETPFSVSKILEPLKLKNFEVETVFIIESEAITSDRYYKREGKEIRPGDLTRIGTYIDRAKELKAFSGTATQVLEYLQNRF